MHINRVSFSQVNQSKQDCQRDFDAVTTNSSRTKMTPLVLVLLCSAFVLGDRPQPQPQPQQYGSPPAPPQPSYHVPKRNCTVDFEKSETEICVPTVSTSCAEETVTLRAPVEKEECLTIPMVSCKAEVTEEEIEICVYVYEKKDVEADAKTAAVKYTKTCETEYEEKCQPKPQPKYKPYGKQEEEEEEEYCKEIPVETCYNRPNAESKDDVVTVSLPTPVRKCEKKRIQVPRVSCTQETEERCFNLVSLEDTTMSVQKCRTELAEPRCNKVSLNLPAQICKEELQRYGYPHGK